MFVWSIGILYRPYTCVLAGQQRQDVESKLAQHWFNDVDSGQSLNQHWFNVSLCQLSVVVYASGTDWPYRQTRIPLDNHMRQRCFNAGTLSMTLAQYLVSVAVLGLLLMPGAVPSKHETLTQCCFNVGQTSEMAGQHLNNIGSYPANTRHWPNVFLLLGRRRRRRVNIRTTLGQCLVFAG